MTSNKIRILVTGGSGFIGTNLIEKFLYDNYEVLNIDISEPKNKLHFKFWKQCDIRNKKNLFGAILDFSPHYTVHLAARTDLNGTCLEDYDTNTTGIKNMIEALNEIKSLKRVIFVSSMYVCQPGYMPKSYDDFTPHTLYGESKAIGEMIVQNSIQNYEWLIVRPSSIWGPWFGEPYALFFRLLKKRAFFHISSKVCTKTYGYIDNTIYQIEQLLLTNELVIKKIFYLGDYEPYNIKEWADEIAAQYNYRIKTIPYIFLKILAIAGDILKRFGIDFPMTSFRLRNMTIDNICDLSLIKALVPDLPVTRIDGIKKTISWLNYDPKDYKK
ncbi:MAG: NAD(P)-dependent oxidoreductase [Elusimicrobiota bacterium]